MVGNCTASTVEQAEKIEKSRSTKAEGKRPQLPENERFFLEIDPKNIKPLGKIIGSELPSVSICPMQRFKADGESKEFRGRNGRQHEKFKREVMHEAITIADLGVHQGLPFLFGVQAKITPYGVVLQFFGAKYHSLTMWRSASKKKLSKNE